MQQPNQQSSDQVEQPNSGPVVQHPLPFPYASPYLIMQNQFPSVENSDQTSRDGHQAIGMSAIMNQQLMRPAFLYGYPGSGPTHGQLYGTNDRSVQQQLAQVGIRLKQMKTDEERELLGEQLKKTPYLFAEFLRLTRAHQQDQRHNHMNQQNQQGSLPTTRPVSAQGPPGQALTPELLGNPGSAPSPVRLYSAKDPEMQQEFARIEKMQMKTMSDKEREKFCAEFNKAPHLFAAFLKFTASQPENQNHRSVNQHNQHRPQLPGSIPGPQLHSQTGSAPNHGQLYGINHRERQQQLAQIEIRLKQTKTDEERELLGEQLKKTPHLFYAFLKLTREQDYNSMNQKRQTKIKKDNMKPNLARGQSEQPDEPME